MAFYVDDNGEAVKEMSCYVREFQDSAELMEEYEKVDTYVL